MKRRFYVLICVIACLFCSCGLSEEDTDILGDYRPMVFVNDTLYGESGEVVYGLQNNAKIIGTIVNIVSQNEPMIEKNFYSNNCPIGSEIYYDEETPEKIYIRILSSNEEKYSIYEIID